MFRSTAYLATTTLMLAAAADAYGLEKYLCVADQSAGFKWTGRKWDQSTFTIDKDRFLVEEVKERSGLKGKVNYIVKQIGSDKELYECSRGEYQGTRFERIWCGLQSDGMMMNVKTLRFQTYYLLGYVDGEDGDSGTPSITIGKCTLLNP